jgi:hypothetical protein
MLKKLKTVIAKKATLICKKECIEKFIQPQDQIMYALLNYNKIRNQAITEVSADLCLARGTVVRWIELKNVPPQYSFDIMKMNDEDIDYTKYTDTEKDQFYTPTDTVKKCYEIFKNKLVELGDDISEYRFIEPSAGAGAFLEVLPSNTIALDIEPNSDLVEQADYLTWEPPKNDKYIVFGNPPFGLRGNLALRFVKHSESFSDYVCFILPQLFESDGKGSPRKRIKGLNLIFSEVISSSFNMPDGRETTVNVVFQIWSKHFKDDKYKIKSYNKKDIKVYSLSNGEEKSQQRNTNMLNKCDIYLPSTCFGEDKMRCYDSFSQLPGQKGYGLVFHTNKKKMTEKAKQISWGKVSFLSTNSAYNLRTSIILEALSE